MPSVSRLRRLGVAVLLDGPRPAGLLRMRIYGRGWPAGLYIVRVVAGEQVQSVQIVKAR